MKMSSTLHNTFTEDLNKFFDYHGGIKAVASGYYTGKTYRRMMWDAFSACRKDRAYGDDHPRYQYVNRILPFDGSHYCFWYDVGLSDNHIDTFLKSYLKKNGIINNVGQYTQTIA